MGTKGNVAMQGSCARGSRTPGLSLKKKNKKKQKVIMEGWGGEGGDQVNNFRKTAVQDAEKSRPREPNVLKGEQEQEIRKCSKVRGSISFETNDDYGD